MTMNLKAITTCMGYQQITSLSSATNLTVPQRTPNGQNGKPVFALIVGMPLAVGIPLQYDGDLTNIKFIEQVAGAKLNISYYL
jgi:hypothetical protein